VQLDHPGPSAQAKAKCARSEARGASGAAHTKDVGSDETVPRPLWAEESVAPGAEAVRLSRTLSHWWCASLKVVRLGAVCRKCGEACRSCGRGGVVRQGRIDLAPKLTLGEVGRVI